MANFWIPFSLLVSTIDFTIRQIQMKNHVSRDFSLLEIIRVHQFSVQPISTLKYYKTKPRDAVTWLMR